MIGIAAALLAGLVVGAAHPTPLAELDGERSQIGFTVKTRWGTVLQGRFPDAQGHVEQLRDGHQRVYLRLPTATVEILDSPGYTQLARGSGFFDAAHHPAVEFVSAPYPPQLLREGGALGGTLRIRGVPREERFVLEPAQCASPGYACDIAGSGAVHRDLYGMSRWSLALHNRVRFALRIRLRDAQ